MDATTEVKTKVKSRVATAYAVCIVAAFAAAVVMNNNEQENRNPVYIERPAGAKTAKPSIKVDQIPGFMGQIIIKGQSYAKGCTGCLTDPRYVPKAAFRVKPQDFGAKGDGVNDDTFALQSALNAVAYHEGGGEVDIPHGTYLVDKLSKLPQDTPTQPPQFDPKIVLDAKQLATLEKAVLNPQDYGKRTRPSALFMHGLRDIIVRCDGAATTVIKKKSGDYTGQDYSTIDIRNSREITFVNCGWDGNMQNIKEGDQAHTLDILATDLTGAPSTGIRVLGNVFRNVKGDGVRFAGSDTAYIRDAIVARSTFDGSSRSGIGVQPGIDHLWFVENKFSNISGPYIDFEPADSVDTVSEPPSDILIADSEFSQQMNDGAVLSVGGLGSQGTSKRILVKNNALNGLVDIGNIEDASFIDNRIDDSMPPLVTDKPAESDHYALIGNGYLKNVRFQGGSIIGKDRAVYVVAHAVGNPVFMVFDGVEFKAARGLEFHSARHIYVVNSHIISMPFVRTAFTGKNDVTRGIYIESESPGYDMNDLEVANDTFEGFQQAVAVNAKSRNTISDVRLFDNDDLAPKGSVFLLKIGPVQGVKDTANVVR